VQCRAHVLPGTLRHCLYCTVAPSRTVLYCTALYSPAQYSTLTLDYTPLSTTVQCTPFSAPVSSQLQVTVLQTFYLILSSTRLARSPDNAQLLSFVRRTVRHCMAHFLSDPGPMLVKMLFWKGRREAMSLAVDGIMSGLKGARRGVGEGAGGGG